MPKVYVNYMPQKDGRVKLFEGVVFVDMPIAVAEYGKEYYSPIVVQGTLYEEEEFVAMMKKQEETSKLKEGQKSFKLKVLKNNKVREAKEDEIQKGDFIEQILPTDTDLSKLEYMNGEILLVNDEEDSK